MKISRNQSLILAVSIIALFFLIGFLFMPKSRSKLPSNSTTATVVATAIPTTPPLETTVGTVAAGQDSKFTLKEFQRFEIKDGRKVWEAKGTSGQYYPETNSAKISDAKVWLYKKDGKVVTLTAGEATLRLQGAGLKGADASKGVVITYNEDGKLETDNLSYDKDKNLIYSPGAVKISGSMFDIEGEVLEGDLEKNSFVIKNNVSTVIKPGKKKDAK